MEFLGITRLEKFRRITNVQLKAWRTQLEIRHPKTRRCLNAELVSQKLFSVSSLLGRLDHRKAVEEKGTNRRNGKAKLLPRGKTGDDSQAVFELFCSLARKRKSPP
jgi:hypothetical protein